MKLNLANLATLARSSTDSPRAAFDLAHRARRVLEIAAETASRNRWTVLDAPTGPAPKEPEAVFAAACAAAVIQYPVQGEARVYAALLDAVDAAQAVSERLYQAWLVSQPRDKPLPLPELGVNRIGGPLAAGCSRGVSAGSGDDEISSAGC